LELLKKSVNGHPTPVDFDYDLDVDVDAGDYCDDDGAKGIKNKHFTMLTGSVLCVQTNTLHPC